VPADSAQVPGRDDVRGAERALDRLELVVEQDGEAAVGEVRAERLCVPTYPPPRATAALSQHRASLWKSVGGLNQ
jgi:hypothetical protein